MYDGRPANTLRFSLDMRIIIVVLLIVIAGMLAVWQPWKTEPGSDARTIDVTGSATVKATPDEYVFYPSYEFTGTDKTALLAEMTAKSDEVVNGLKQTGVEDSKIKTNSNGYDFPIYYGSEKPDEVTYNLSLTVTVTDKELAQKVQDYLVSTTPTGSVSPQTSFSETKRKELEDTARDQATQDARKKADQSAKNLGFKVDRVKTVNDGNGFSGGGCGPYGLCAATELSADAGRDVATTQLSVQPGENELTYSVSVTYFIK